MIYLLFCAVSLLVLLPLLLGVRSMAGTPHGRRATALAFHRQQIADLDQDRAAFLLPNQAYDQALLEVQRRLLAADTGTDENTTATGKAWLTAVALGAPVLALGLYLAHGEPWLVGKVPASPGMLQQSAIAVLKDKLAHLDPTKPEARRGWNLLGRIDAEHHDMAGAAAAWRMELRSGFDPYIAVAAAEADREARGHPTQDDLDLFRRALQALPNGPFRPMVERRLHETPP